MTGLEGIMWPDQWLVRYKELSGERPARLVELARRATTLTVAEREEAISLLLNEIVRDAARETR